MHRRKFTISQINQPQRGNQFNNLHRICLHGPKISDVFIREFVSEGLTCMAEQIVHTITALTHDTLPKKMPTDMYRAIIFSPAQWRGL